MALWFFFSVIIEHKVLLEYKAFHKKYGFGIFKLIRYLSMIIVNIVTKIGSPQSDNFLFFMWAEQKFTLGIVSADTHEKFA